MASPVGLHVVVHLTNNTTVRGVVQDLVPNSHLTLRDVTTPGAPTLLNQFLVQVSAIRDLEVIDTSITPQPTPDAPTPNTSSSPAPSARHVSAPPSSSIAAPTPQRQAPSFVDPAILSLGNASPSRNSSAPRPAAVETPVKAMFAKAAHNLPSPASPFIGDVNSKANSAQKMTAAKETPSKEPRQPIFVSDTIDVAQDGKKKLRRGQKTKKQSSTPGEAADPPPVMNSEVSRNGNDMNGSVKRGKGWRNTPLLQPSPQSGQANTKKSRRTGKDEEFAQGDTTDIPDADFDFEEELKKFDKKQVFDEIRQSDTGAEEDLLVSHNRARPGTYGGKNLHPTEPVLSPKVAPKYHSNEVDSTSDADTELNFLNGRSSSRHSATRTKHDKKLPRSNSGQLEPKPYPLAPSIAPNRAANKSVTSLASKGKPASLSATSPQPERSHSPQSMFPDPHFVVVSQATHCPVLLPQALETLEAAAAQLGLGPEASAETAARSIAEAALALSTASAVRRPSRTNTLRSSMTSSAILEPPAETVIVVLAGNHTAGARALAAARHLVSRSVRIIIAESSDDAGAQDPGFKAQLAFLRRMIRAGADVKRGNWKKASQYIRSLTGAPTVIIDALLAGSSELPQESREMINWANQSRGPVLSIACPSGFSGVDGSSTVVNGEPLAIKADKVLALGAPMHGLLKITEAEELDISLADIGLNVALRREEAYAFGRQWVVDLSYVDEQAVGDGL